MLPTWTAGSGPQIDPAPLDRILPFAASHNSATARDALFARVAARGRLRVGEVLLSSVRFGKLDANAKIDGRSLVLQGAQADFYGGRVNGELDASLVSEPSYSFHGRVDRVDLGLLSDSANVLAGRFAGFAAGELSLAAHGIGRQPLAASLEGEGVLRLRDVMVRGIDRSVEQSPDRVVERSQGKVLPSPARTGESDSAAEARYSSAAATFHVAAGRVRIDQLLLVGRDEQFEVDGSIDFARQLNLHARAVPSRRGVRAAGNRIARRRYLGQFGLTRCSPGPAANVRGGRAAFGRRGAPLTRTAMRGVLLRRLRTALPLALSATLLVVLAAATPAQRKQKTAPASLPPRSEPTTEAGAGRRDALPRRVPHHQRYQDRWLGRRSRKAPLTSSSPGTLPFASKSWLLPAAPRPASRRLRTTYEQTSATVQSDTPDPQTDAIVKQYQQLEGHSIEFTLGADGSVTAVSGLEGLNYDQSAITAAQQWMSQLSAGGAVPSSGKVSPGLTWTS